MRSMKGWYFKACLGERYELGCVPLCSYFPGGEAKAQRGRGLRESLDRLVEQEDSSVPDKELFCHPAPSS